jgi:hypothetical protein
MSLELVSTEELIRELFSRKTLAAVIIYSPSDHKFDHQRHKQFRLITTADNNSTIALLQAGLQSMAEIVT